ncbi:MAG: hypothetical protein Fur0044_00070 [Anaerolineae bacterium]
MLQKLNLFKVSIIGAVVTAVCCFTPVLVIFLGAVGLSWWVGYLDYVLYPALFVFIGLTTYAWWRNRQPGCAANEVSLDKAGEA